jgi:hypothetical protein
VSLYFAASAFPLVWSSSIPLAPAKPERRNKLKGSPAPRHAAPTVPHESRPMTPNGLDINEFW